MTSSNGKAGSVATHSTRSVRASPARAPATTATATTSPSRSVKELFGPTVSFDRGTNAPFTMSRAHAGVKRPFGPFGTDKTEPVSSTALATTRHDPSGPSPRTVSPAEAPKSARVAFETSKTPSATPPADVRRIDAAKSAASRGRGVGAIAAAPAAANTVWLRGVETARKRAATRRVATKDPFAPRPANGSSAARAIVAVTSSESIACVSASTGDPSSHGVSDGREGAMGGTSASFEEEEEDSSSAWTEDASSAWTEDASSAWTEDESSSSSAWTEDSSSAWTEDSSSSSWSTSMISSSTSVSSFSTRASCSDSSRSSAAFFFSKASSRLSWSPSTKPSRSTAVCTSSRKSLTAATTSFGVESYAITPSRVSAAGPAETTVACQVWSPARSTTRRATPASGAAVSFTEMRRANHTGTGGVTTAPSTRTSSQSGRRPAPALAPSEEASSSSSSLVPSRAVRHASSSPRDALFSSSAPARASSATALRSISFPADCSYACTSSFSSALGRTPVTVMNPALGSDTREPASTTRVLPLGAARISSAVISRPVIRETKGASSEEEASSSSVEEASSEEVLLTSAAFPTRAESREELSARVSVAASFCASFFASSRRPSNSAPAASASSAVAAVATTAVPTLLSPTNTASRVASPLFGPARTLTRNLSPSFTVTERGSDFPFPFPFPSAPPRAICMVSSRVHTDTLLSRRVSTASSLPSIFAKTPFASPPGATRRSEPLLSSAPRIAAESDSSETESKDPRTASSGRSNASSAKRTVTAARAPSPTPDTITAGASTGGSTIHWPARGAVTSRTCAVVPGAAPSRVMCADLRLIASSLRAVPVSDAVFIESDVSDATFSAASPEEPSSLFRRPRAPKASAESSTRARNDPDRPPITSVATRSRRGGPVLETPVFESNVPSFLPNSGTFDSTRSSVSASVSARTLSWTTSPRASCVGARVGAPFTMSSAQGRRSVAKRASPSRSSRCAIACGASFSKKTRVGGVSAHAPGATSAAASGSDANKSGPDASTAGVERDPLDTASRPSTSFSTSAISARVAVSSLSRGSDFERNAAARAAARAFCSSRVIGFVVSARFWRAASSSDVSLFSLLSLDKSSFSSAFEEESSEGARFADSLPGSSRGSSSVPAVASVFFGRARSRWFAFANVSPFGSFASAPSEDDEEGDDRETIERRSGETLFGSSYSTPHTAATRRASNVGGAHHASERG